MEDYSLEILEELRKISKQLKSMENGIVALFDDSQHSLSNMHQIEDAVSKLVELKEKEAEKNGN